MLSVFRQYSHVMFNVSVYIAYGLKIMDTNLCILNFFHKISKKKKIHMNMYNVQYNLHFA